MSVFVCVCLFLLICQSSTDNLLLLSHRSSRSVSLEIDSCVLERGTALIFFFFFSVNFPFTFQSLYFGFPPVADLIADCEQSILLALSPFLFVYCAPHWKGFAIMWDTSLHVDGSANSKDLTFIVCMQHKPLTSFKADRACFVLTVSALKGNVCESE